MNKPYQEWAKKKLDYVHVSTALQNLVQQAQIRPTPIELPLTQALGLRLSENVVATRDRPAWDLSHVDGYAVRSSDTKTRECLKRVGGVDPRAAQSYELGDGEAVYVDTGFPLPRGADAVVPVEEAELVEGGDCVRVPQVEPGANVIPRGIEYRRGQILARKGERLTGAHARVLLDAGITKVRVYRRARIGLVPIGDELAPPPSGEAEEPPSGKVWESSTIMVRGLLSHLPVEVGVHKIVGDKPDEIVAAVKSMLSNGYEIVATIGGVSVGRKDQTWLALKEALNPLYTYRGIKVVQGRVNSGMALERAVVLTLPGFVQSTFTGTVLFLAPLSNWLTGGPLSPGIPCWKARLAKPLKLGAKRKDFYKMRFAYPADGGDPGEIVVEPHVESSMALPLTASLGFVIIPPNIGEVGEGELLTVYDPLHRRGWVDCSEWPFSPQLGDENALGR